MQPHKQHMRVAPTMLGQDLEVRIRVRLHRLSVPNIQAPRKVLARIETGCNSRWRQCACSQQQSSRHEVEAVAQMQGRAAMLHNAAWQ